MAVLLQQKGAAMLHHLFVTEDRGERDVVVDCHRGTIRYPTNLVL
jgi:hypothetical protein